MTGLRLRVSDRWIAYEDEFNHGGWVKREETAAGSKETGDAIVEAMAEGGIEFLFFTSGSELVFYQEAIAKAQALGRKAPRLITMIHENPSLNAALGYAAASGKPAATAAHVDVGTQHYGSAIHTAYRSGLPVLVTAGAPPVGLPGTRRGARDAAHLWLQDMYDQNGIVRQYMKWDHRLELQDNPGLVVSRAIQVACTPPCGPVYLSLPREVALAALESEGFPRATQLGIPRPPAPDAEAILQIAERLVAARNPAVVLSGSGRNPASVAELVQFCELLGVPVVDAAWRAYHCFPMNHPLYQASMSLAACDFVLVFESDVPWLPGPHSPAADAYVAVVDIDPVKLKIPTYEFRASVRLISGTSSAVRALMQAVRPLITQAHRARIQERAERWGTAARQRVAAARAEALAASTRTPIDPLWLACCIGDALDENCVLVDDTLSHNPMARFVALGGSNRYFRNPASAGGWGPGAALGVKFALPQRDVVLATGDGFYVYGSPNAAIWAARHHNAPFMTVIFQNRSYSTGTRAAASYYPDGHAVRSGFEGGYFDPPIDFAREAEAAGAYGENVRDPAQIASALQRGLAQIRNGIPAVIAVWLPRMLQKD
jgi:acetolactate synthase-1/2/3 large subunit